MWIKNIIKFISTRFLPECNNVLNTLYSISKNLTEDITHNPDFEKMISVVKEISNINLDSSTREINANIMTMREGCRYCTTSETSEHDSTSENSKHNVLSDKSKINQDSNVNITHFDESTTHSSSIESMNSHINFSMENTEKVKKPNIKGKNLTRYGERSRRTIAYAIYKGCKKHLSSSSVGLNHSSYKYFSLSGSNCQVIVCQLCGQFFRNIRELKLHLRVHNIFLSIQDKTEKRSTNNYPIIRKKSTYALTVPRYLISNSTKNSRTSTAVGITSVEQMQRCLVCKQVCSNQLKLRYHVLTSHKDQPLECKFCSMIFTRYSYLERHHMEHKSYHLSYPVINTLRERAPEVHEDEIDTMHDKQKEPQDTMFHTRKEFKPKGQRKKVIEKTQSIVKNMSKDKIGSPQKYVTEKSSKSKSNVGIIKKNISMISKMHAVRPQSRIRTCLKKNKKRTDNVSINVIKRNNQYKDQSREKLITQDLNAILMQVNDLKYGMKRVQNDLVKQNQFKSDQIYQETLNSSQENIATNMEKNCAKIVEAKMVKGNRQVVRYRIANKMGEKTKLNINKSQKAIGFMQKNTAVNTERHCVKTAETNMTKEQKQVKLRGETKMEERNKTNGKKSQKAIGFMQKNTSTNMEKDCMKKVVVAKVWVKKPKAEAKSEKTTSGNDNRGKVGY